MSAQICQSCTAAYSIGAPRCPQCGAKNPRPVDDGPNGPTVTVRCGNKDCEEYGAQRQVPLRLAAPGVVERPSLHCLVCDWALETVHDEPTDDKEQDVPKVTVHNGPSIEGTEETNIEMANGRLVHLDADESADEGGEEPSPTPEAGGTTSSTSSEKEPTTPEQNGSDSPKPARTTANRSKKAPTGGSSAPGTDGAPTAPTSDTTTDKD